MARTAVLGLPRIGPNRELKFALESFWAGRTGADELEETARALRAANWQRAQAAGIDVIPSGDFSLYDHVLDTAWALGAVDREAGYFALARGSATRKPLELTKWLDTNYHYLVPELERRPAVRARRVALDRAAARGGRARDRDAAGRARAVQLPAAVQGRAARAGGARARSTSSCCASWPRPARPRCSSTSRTSRWTARRASSTRSPTRGPRCADAPGRALPGDVLRARRRSASSRSAPTRSTSTSCAPRSSCARRWRRRGRLSLGVLDGRNVWAADLDLALDRIDAAVAALGLGARDDRAVVLAAARAVRGRARDRSRSARGWRSRPRSWPSWALLKAALDGDRDALLEPAREVRHARRAAALRRPEVRRRARRRLRARRAVRGPARGAARAARAAGAADDDDRLVPADAGDPRGAHAAGLRALPGAHDRRGDRPPGARRPRRARARRARAQGHGRVLRRAAARVRVLRARLGAVLRLALREAADPLRRRLAPGADDRALVAVRAVADREAGQGDADRAGDDPAVVVRARRPAARRDLHADRARDPGRGGRPRGRGLLRDPGRRGRAARGAAAAPRGPGRLPALGGRLLPADGRARPSGDPDPHAHVLLGVQRDHGPHRAPGRRRALDRGLPLGHGGARGPATTRTRSGRASTTSTRRGCRASTRSSGCWSWPRSASAASGCG